ncbi:hypothetical protein M885DRAFT_536642 [Pelagophyceae sp. CCMP2097]|nr:hypothetical protein M885DRAFT_536642 [Pelagophyceae sp. CCMP2097]
MLEAQLEDLLRRRTLAAQAASAAPTASSIEAQLEELLRQRTLAAQAASSAAPGASLLEAQFEVLLQRRAQAAPSATLSLSGLLQGYMPPAPDMLRQVGCQPFHAAYRPPALDLHHLHLLDLQTQQTHQQQQLLQLLLSGLHRGQVEPPSPRFSLPYQPPAHYYSPQPAAHVFSPSPVHYLSPGYHQAPVQSSPLDELLDLLAASGRRL